MGEGVFPKVQVKAFFTEGAYHRFVIREKGFVPFICAGICMSVPAGFKTDHRAGDIVCAEIVRHGEDTILVIVTVTAIKHAETPVGYVTAAARQHIVLSDDVSDCFAFDYVYINSVGGGYLYGNDAFCGLAVGIQLGKARCGL